MHVLVYVSERICVCEFDRTFAMVRQSSSLLFAENSVLTERTTRKATSGTSQRRSHMTEIVLNTIFLNDLEWN